MLSLPTGKMHSLWLLPFPPVFLPCIYTCGEGGSRKRTLCLLGPMFSGIQVRFLFTWLLLALLAFSCAVGNSHLAAPFLSWLLITWLCPLGWDGLYLVPTGCRPESLPCATADPLAHRSTSESEIGPLSLGNQWLICRSCLTPNRP